MAKSMHRLSSFRYRRKARRGARQAISWLHARTPKFKIANDHKSSSIPWRVKPIGELIFLLSVLKKHDVKLPLLRELTTFALAEAATFDWQELAAFDPSAATPLALVADFYIMENQPVPFDMSYFDLLRRIDFFEGMDRLPYREMDVAYSFSLLGIPDQQSKVNSWFCSTAFGRQQHLARYTIDDMYSLTHSIFYLTDVGCKPVEGNLDPPTCRRLQRELVALTAIMMRSDNIDVLGELLLCWIFCGLKPTSFELSIFTAGLQHVLASSQRAGAVAPSARVKRRADETEATFDELYHTTLVAALLFSLVDKQDFLQIGRKSS